jgi:hypothetical protein
MQLFVRVRLSLVGQILAREHRQEPPEDILRGTPRLIFGTPCPRAAVAAALAARDLPHRAVGRRVYLRDPGGNYLELECAAR